MTFFGPQSLSVKKYFAQATDLFNMTKLPEPQIKEQANKQDSLSLAHSPNATLKKKINVI